MPFVAWKSEAGFTYLCGARDHNLLSGEMGFEDSLAWMLAY
jgi:hypothetical protein